MPTEIKITSFDPLTIEMPEEPKGGGFTDKIIILLPPVKITLFRLNLGGEHLGDIVSMAPATSIEITPHGSPTAEQLYTFIHESRAALKEVWDITQKTIDNRGPLLGNR